VAKAHGGGNVEVFLDEASSEGSAHAHALSQGDKGVECELGGCDEPRECQAVHEHALVTIGTCDVPEHNLRCEHEQAWARMIFPNWIHRLRRILRA
jgi:hypothetical protein